jgi:hypothetical protein
MSDKKPPERDNIEIFDLAVGVIFADLYCHFPIPKGMVPESLAMTLLEEQYWEIDITANAVCGRDDRRQETQTARDYSSIVRHTLAWLEKCGYIIGSAPITHLEAGRAYVLAPKTLEVLAWTPKSLTAPSDKPLGKHLTTAATSLGNQAARAAITDIVGQVIGAAGRAFITGA